VKYASHCTGQAARGIPEIKFCYFSIVPIHPRLQGGAFSAPAGKIWLRFALYLFSHPYLSTGFFDQRSIQLS